jgi:GNAT superfamily N-acetyltransferase
MCGSIADEVDRPAPKQSFGRALVKTVATIDPAAHRLRVVSAGGPKLSDFTIRVMERTDRTRWAPLWRGYLHFYRAQVSDEVDHVTFARIFDPLEPVHALVAERGDELIGLAHYLFQRSTWLINPQCYLQDLYVGEGTRGRGVGRALIEAVVGAAMDAGAARVFWNTHETNAVARRLYDAVAERTGFIQYRIDPLG